jgi:hypothetical protein
MGSIDEDIVYEAQTIQGCYLQKLSMIDVDIRWPPKKKRGAHTFRLSPSDSTKSI